jgi:hypothetical protein
VKRSKIFYSTTADLHKLGGLTAIVEELNRPEEDLRVLAAWILGKASQNNGLVQDQVINCDTLAPKNLLIYFTICA